MVYVMALNLPHCYLSLIQTRRIPQRQTKRNSSSNPNLAGSNVYLNWRKGKCCLARVVCMFPVVTLNKKPGAGDHAGESKGWFIVRPDFWDSDLQSHPSEGYPKTGGTRKSRNPTVNIVNCGFIEGICSNIHQYPGMGLVADGIMRQEVFGYTEMSEVQKQVGLRVAAKLKQQLGYLWS